MVLACALVLSSLLIAVHLLLALGCGGSFLSFLRPIHNARKMRTHLRQSSYWQGATRTVCEFVAAFRLLHLLWMGMLGFCAVYVWLVLPTWLFTLREDVTNRWQLMGFVAGFVALTISLLWLPLLLAHVAVEARLGAILEFSAVRKRIGKTPLGWAIATALLLACSCLPLLYEALFKIQIPPHAAQWDLMLVFLLTVFPARVLLGWVYHRATQRTGRAPSWPWRIWQCANGTALCIGVGYYVYFLNLAATGGELGENSIWQFHAMLLPFPF